MEMVATVTSGPLRRKRGERSIRTLFARLAFPSLGVFPLLLAGCLTVRHVPERCHLETPRVEIAPHARGSIHVTAAIQGVEGEWIDFSPEFLLDTGSSTCVLSKKELALIDVRVGSEYPWVINSAGGTRIEWRAAFQVPALRLGDHVVFSDAPFVVGKTGHAGVIGNGILEHCALAIGCGRGQVHLLEEEIAPRAGDIPIEIVRGVPTFEIEVDGRRHRVVFDTGYKFGELRLPAGESRRSGGKEISAVRIPVISPYGSPEDYLELEPSEVFIEYGPGIGLAGTDLFDRRSLLLDLRTNVLRVSEVSEPAAQGP